MCAVTGMAVMQCRRWMPAEYRAARICQRGEADVCGVLTIEGQRGQPRTAGFGLGLCSGVGLHTLRGQGVGYRCIERRYRHGFLHYSGRDFQLPLCGVCVGIGS